ncbi:MAG: hypothetical protein HY874_05420 [Chloroflexi bacterium]|nr:hypothetical protein [Chloroflexota bacterium]
MPPRRVRVSAGKRPLSRTKGSLTIRDFLALVHEGVIGRLGKKRDGLDGAAALRLPARSRSAKNSSLASMGCSA